MMKIKDFKFNKDMYTKTYTSVIIKNTKYFGMTYLAYYLDYAFKNLLKKENNDDLQRIIDEIETTCISFHLQFLETKYYLEHLNCILKRLPKETQNLNQDLYNILYDVLNQPLRIYTKKLPIIKNDLLYSERTRYERLESTYYDIKNKLGPALKEEFNYIYIKDNSEAVKNWYSYETHTRHMSWKSKRDKFVVPFYRLIHRDVVVYHILIFLRYDLYSHKYPAYWHRSTNSFYYSPKEYNGDMEKIGEYLRLRLQRNSLFNIDNNYENKDNKYYFYSGKFIDINRNFYELNKKWLQEAAFIKACKKL